MLWMCNCWNALRRLMRRATLRHSGRHLHCIGHDLWSTLPFHAHEVFMTPALLTALLRRITHWRYTETTAMHWGQHVQALLDHRQFFHHSHRRDLRVLANDVLLNAIARMLEDVWFAVTGVVLQNCWLHCWWWSQYIVVTYGFLRGHP